VLALPGFFGSALDPVIGLAGDTPRRRALMVAGGLAFAISAGLSGVAVGFWTLLVALMIGNPASGAFVSLAQATLMDREPGARERNMARWTAAGSIGYVLGPLLIAGAVATGLGWRGVLVALGGAALPLTLALRRTVTVGETPRQPVRGGLRQALRDREVRRWLALLEASDLLLDVFHGFLALYFVDVVRASLVEGAAAVLVWTVAGLVGDVALLVVLRHIGGTTYLRASALLVLAAYPLFLLVPSERAKLVALALLGLLNSGWYAIPKAGLYAALPGRSGAAVAVGGLAGLAGAAVPALLGAVAQGLGLQVTMWILVVAPVVLLVGVPRIDSGTMEQVSDLLQDKERGLLTISSEASVYEAVKQMVDANVGSLLVTVNERIEGIVTERDYLRRVTLEGRTDQDTQVSEIMSSPLIIVTPETSVEECMAIMTDRRIRHMPVVEDGEVIGLVSIGDIVKFQSKQQSFKIQYLTDFITAR
jgi:MFS transporter, FSR family, fosmidomycin resistance protein